MYPSSVHKNADMAFEFDTPTLAQSVQSVHVIISWLNSHACVMHSV